MNAARLVDAFDAIAHSESFHARLEATVAELSRRQGLKAEKAWLSEALARVASARETVGDLLTRALRLDALAPVREEHSKSLQQAAVDAVERLQAGIMFHGGSRAPLGEALFAKLKVPALRRAARADFAKFCADFEKRLGGAYVKRMLNEPGYAPLAPAVAATHTAFDAWRGAFSPEPLPEADAEALAATLESTAHHLELPLLQARLLAEAACAPVKGLFDESGLGAKAKRRVHKTTSDAAAAEAPTPPEEAPAAAAPEAPEAAPPAKKKARRAKQADDAAPADAPASAD